MQEPQSNAISEETFNKTANDEKVQEAYKKYLETQKANGSLKDERENINSKDFVLDSVMQEKLSQQEAQNNPYSQQAQETINIANNLNGAYARYRNTGIEYFDRLENPTIGDLFLAKQLGLNMSYVDMNVNMNANVKNTNVSKQRGEIDSLSSDMKTLFDSISYYDKADDAGGLPSRFGRALYSGTGGLWTWGISKENQQIEANNKRDIYSAASLMAGGAGRRTNKFVEDSEALVSNRLKNRDGYLAGAVSILESGLNNINEKYESMQSSGIPLRQSDMLKQQLFNSLLKDVKYAQGGNKFNEGFDNRIKALGILNEKGDDGIVEAVKLIYSK